MQSKLLQKKELRIAVVSGFPPDSYGEAQYAGEVFLSLAKQFPEVQLLILAHKNDNVPTYSKILPNLYVKRVTYPNERLRSSLSIFSLLMEILKFKADLVHFQGTHTPRYGGLFGEPISLLMILLRSLHIPSVVTIHSLWFPDELNQLWLKKGINPWLAKVLNFYYKFNFWVISHTVSAMNLLVVRESSEIVSKYIHIYGLNRAIIHEEIHPCKFQPVSEQEKEKAKMELGLNKYRLVIAVGFARPDKGLHVLIESAAILLDKFQDVAIVVAGAPPTKADQEYCNNLRMQRDKLTNRNRIILRFEPLSDEEFMKYLVASDIIVAPYLRSIGASGPIHYGLGLGKPIVASAIGLNANLDGVCLLVPPGDAWALAQALDYLLSDEAAYQLYCQRALDYASRWTWDDLARQYVEQYRKLVGPGCSDQDGST
jgi:glycosyltransferase involved in cell wall biosynthesis